MRRSLRLCASALASALLLTACGGNQEATTTDDEAGASAGGTGAEVASSPSDGVEDEVIRIGWMGDVTGPSASIQALNLRGLQAYVERLNDDGGVLGREVRVVVRDDGYAAEAGVQNFQSLVNDEPVLAISQVGGSHIMDAVAPDAQRIGIPLVSVAQTTDSGLANDHVFHTIAHYADQADVAVERMIERIGSADDLRVVVLQTELPSGDEWNDYVARKVEERGATYVGRVTMDPAEVDPTSVVTNLQRAIREDGANHVAMHGTPAQTLVLLNGLSDVGASIPVIGTHGIASLNVYSEGPADQVAEVDGIHSFLTYADDAPGAEEIRTFIEGEGSAYAGDAAHNGFSQGWVGGAILHQAIERAAETGELTRGSLTEALRGTFDVGGLTCPVDWTSSNHSPCAAPFRSDDGETMTIEDTFERWSSAITGVYGDA